MSHGRGAQSQAARFVALAGGVVFVASLGYFLYAYVIRFGVPAGPWSWRAAAGPLAMDAALFTVFAAHHSWLARAGLKAHVQRLVSPALERTAYVWIASLLFLAVCAWWQPVPGIAWSAGGPWPVLFRGVQLAGALLTLVAARRIDVLELAGIRQTLPGPRQPTNLISDGVYGWVRHPIYLGWLLLVWPSPVMTGTRFVFAAISTIYLVMAVPFEERDLGRTLGEAYAAYRRKVRWRMVPGVY